MTNPRILIVGAGIGGLVAALSLIERGFEVQVLEQTRELAAVGAGVQLSPNSTRVLFGLGLGPTLQTMSVFPGGKCIRLWNSGQEWELFDLGAECVARYGYPYMMLHRADLHAALVAALYRQRPDALVLEAKVVDVAHNDDGVAVMLANGRSLSADGLVGADGIHSIVRARIIGQDRPRFSGCIAWRGVIPIETLPPSLQRPAGVNWVGPGAHVIHYPIHAGRKVGFVGIVEKQGWYRESWTESGSIDECRDDFRGWHPDVHALIRQLDQPLRWALMVRDPLETWTRGRVTLLGDAAHPTLPFLAQGAAMAIEDGCVLARALQDHPSDVSAAWRVYQSTRIERATRIVQLSASNMQRFHNTQLGDAERAAVYIEQEWAESKVRSRYEWLFSYKPEQVPLALMT